MDGILSCVSDLLAPILALIAPLLDLVTIILDPIINLLRPILEILGSLFAAIGKILGPIIELISPLLQLINEILDKEFDGAISKQKQRDLLDAVARNPDDYIICSKEHMVNLAKYLKETFERLDFEVKVFCNSVLGDCYDD